MNEQTATCEFDWAGKKIKFETGKLALLADSAIRVDFGQTSVLISVVIGQEPKETDFFPLLVDYEEKFYASGKISGSRFIKREGKPSEQAVLNARIIDRPIRPMFPKNYRNDIQIVITVLSYDPHCPPEIPSILGASLALSLSNAPFAGPIGAVRVAVNKGEFVLNPSDELVDLDLDFIVVGNKERILMVEGKASELPEDKIIEVLSWAHKQLMFTIKAQEEFMKKTKIEKPEFVISESDIHLKVSDLLGSELKGVLKIIDQKEREDRLSQFQQ